MSTTPDSIRPRRPFGVTLLALILLLLAAAGWLRFQQALSSWSLLASLGIWPGPLYLALGGAAWGSVGLPACGGLWLGKRWSLRLAWMAACFYPLAFWIDRLFLSPAPEARTGWPFWLGATLLWLGYVFILIRSRVTRLYLVK